MSKLPKQARQEIAWLHTLGITDDEIAYHPKLGVCVSQSGLRKLVAIAPDQDRARDLLEAVAEARRQRMHVVKPDVEQ
jgi:hypothetical protein